MVEKTKRRSSKISKKRVVHPHIANAKDDRYERPMYRVVIVTVVLLVLIIDQVTKSIASLQGSVVLNTGVSFGMFNSSWMTVALIVFYIWLFEWTCPRWHRQYPIATGLFLGGGLSNLVERVAIGGVRDFLSIPILSMSNNLADWAIFIGLAWILFRETQKSMLTPFFGRRVR